MAAAGIWLLGLLAVTGGLMLGSGEVEDEEEEEVDEEREEEEGEEREEQLEVSMRGGSFPPLPCKSQILNIFFTLGFGSQNLVLSLNKI